MSDDGNYTTLDGVADNDNSEMPRDYHDDNNSYGDYYNWYAATAESGTRTTSPGDEAENSICPKGWQLPVNGITTNGVTDKTKSWGMLLNDDRYYNYIDVEGTQTDNNEYGTAEGPSMAMRKLPLSLPFTGHYYWGNGKLYYRDSGGYFWSSAAAQNNYGRHLVLRTNNISPQNGLSKNYGLSVRCVKK